MRIAVFSTKPYDRQFLTTYRILSFPNVLVTGHQALFTANALRGIGGTTIADITAFARDGRAVHEVSVEKLA